MPAVFLGTEDEVGEKDCYRSGREENDKGGEGNETEGVVGARGEEAGEHKVKLNKCGT